MGEQQRAGNGGRGHHQQIRHPLGAQRQPLVHAEAVLLIHHREAEIAERHLLLENRMGADENGQRARRCALENLPPGGALHIAGEQGHRHGGQTLEQGVVLAGENLGGGHQRRLRSGFHRLQAGEQRHQRLAGSDIALQQPAHAVGGGHIGLDLRQRPQLRGGGGQAGGLQRRRAQAAIAAHRPAGLAPPQPPRDGEGDLPGQ